MVLIWSKIKLCNSQFYFVAIPVILASWWDVDFLHHLYRFCIPIPKESRTLDCKAIGAKSRILDLLIALCAKQIGTELPGQTCFLVYCSFFTPFAKLVHFQFPRN